MSISKTIIIGINMHGEIPLDINGTPIQAIVPEGMYISVISATVCGVPNISTLDNYENIAEGVSEQTKMITNWNTMSKREINDISQSIKNILIATNNEESSNIIKDYQSLYKKGKQNTDMARFSHHYDKAFNISTFDSESNIPNKLYLKFQEGEVQDVNNIEPYYFNKIVIYNLDGEPDIFELLQSMGMNIDEISTLDMLTFLRSLGVENLIIVDLSCNVFKGDSAHLTDRNIRQIRRTMKRGGKKSKSQLKDFKKNCKMRVKNKKKSRKTIKQKKHYK